MVLARGTCRPARLRPSGNLPRRPVQARNYNWTRYIQMGVCKHILSSEDEETGVDVQLQGSLFHGSPPFRGATPPGPKLASSIRDGTVDRATPSILSAAKQPRIPVYCQSRILPFGVAGMKRGLVRACERLSPNLVRFGRLSRAQELSPPGNAVTSLSALLWTSSMQGTESRISEDERALDSTKQVPGKDAGMRASPER